MNNQVYDEGFMDYYNNIKNELINNEITKKIKDYSKNKSDLETYYRVGKLLSDAGKHYGEGIIKKYSETLTVELGKKYNITLLKRIRKFYLIIEKGATMSHQLTLSHYFELLSINDAYKVNYYIDISIKQNLSIRELRHRIKNKEYERLDESTRNKLIEKEEVLLPDLVKDPIVINNKYNYEFISEKILQKLILEDITNFMKELGEGFSFIDNEYKIKIGDSYNYIDLLLFNYIYNCFVVIELKVTELKKEYIGQIETYMNYVDRNIGINKSKTIGIIIVKKNNKFIMEYCSDNRIISREFKITNYW